MKVLTRRFNIYLALAALLGLVCGCQSDKDKPPTAAVRVHIEVTPEPTGGTQPISVIRSDPVLVTIKRDPILKEANLVEARVIDAQGGFALQFKFDENGTWLLEQYSASNQGRHFVIWGEWSDNDLSLFSPGDILNLPSFANKLNQPADAVSLFLKGQLSAATQAALTDYQIANTNSIPLQTALVEDLNKIIRSQTIYSTQRFAGVVLRQKTQQLLAQNPQTNSPRSLNRLLLEDAYPLELSRNHKSVLVNRWLAAPVISRRISNGVLTFTADCERDEADQLVTGLNAAYKEIHKHDLK